MATSDFFPFISKTTKESSNVSTSLSAPPPFCDTYKMNHRNRGVAIIFNHVNFEKPEWKRDGSNKDRDNLIDMFHMLNFNVLVHDDLTAIEVKDVLSMVSQMNHSNNDCLAIVVMSHGDSGKIFAADQFYPIDILWDNFSAEKCQTLAGKPKLFFVQACRGTNIHNAVHLAYDTTDAKMPMFYSIPVMCDILIMYSTIDGYYSWRDPTNGAQFIQSLINQMKAHYKQKDLLTILTCVNRDVAVNFTSNEPATPALDGKKQMCSIVSMLTKQIYFKNSD